jgi:hypothetical protein
MIVSLINPAKNSMFMIYQLLNYNPVQKYYYNGSVVL